MGTLNEAARALMETQDALAEARVRLSAKDAEIERLKAQLAASEEKRKVLGAECQAWRKAWQDVPCSKPECSICLSTKATDAVSALEGT